ncbi:MAG: 50S ribosomal protein L5, partial [Gemmatimonadota bacterium]|nr:50S ribosomal protein L5 [Gemmatimonadota bacterium]
MVPRMKEEYAQDVVPALMKKFSYGNIMMVPRLEKITVNMGVGEAFQNPKALEEASATLRTITGQQPTIRKARVSIANFKLREGMKVGTMVTLRRDMM